MSTQLQTTELPETKRKLVDAGVNLMRSRGFNATTVDDVCAAAGVTKGGFFHYFKSKDNLAAAAVTRFHELKANQGLLDWDVCPGVVVYQPRTSRSVRG